MALLSAYCAAAAARGTLAQQRRQSAEDEALRLSNTLVTLGVSVVDKKGRQVPNLSRDDFTVYEDDRRQRLEFFVQQDQPISFGLLLDTSASMAAGRKLDRAKAAAVAFLRAGNPQNETFCLSFNDKLTLLSDFTSDYAKVQSDISKIAASGGTALYDAIIAGMERLGRAKHPKRALLVITDGCDEHSRHKLPELIERVQRSDTQIYTIGIFSPYEAAVYDDSGPTFTLVDGKEIDNPQLVFRTLAVETGAKTFFPSSADELDRIMDSIAASLRRQYTMAYYPGNLDDSTRYRRINVRVAGPVGAGLKVVTRKGYRLGARSPSQPIAAAELAEVAPEPPVVLEPGPDDYRDRLDHPASGGWPVNAAAFYKDGKYHLLGHRAVPVKNYVYSDFDAAVTIAWPHGLQAVEPSANSSPARRQPPSAGLAFRISADSYYLFLLIPSAGMSGGSYSLTKVTRGKTVVLTRWTSDRAISSRNRIEVRCRGARIELLANDAWLTSIDERESLAPGRVSLVVSGGEAAFSDLIVKTR